jgi:hypothetical protein
VGVGLRADRDTVLARLPLVGIMAVRRQPAVQDTEHHHQYGGRNGTDGPSDHGGDDTGSPGYAARQAMRLARSPFSCPTAVCIFAGFQIAIISRMIAPSCMAIRSAMVVMDVS